MSTPYTDHIEKRSGVCGGKPCIRGTLIRVLESSVWPEVRGKSPDEIHEHFQMLTIADIHAALAYYFDHQDEIQREIEEGRQFAEQLKQQQLPTAPSGGKDVHGSSFSP